MGAQGGAVYGLGRFYLGVYIRAYLAHFEYVGVFRMFSGRDLKRVP
jgi:hypothetical protein